MKTWLRMAVVFSLLCIPTALLAVDYRVILEDGSWLRSAERPERMDGKARVRLPALARSYRTGNFLPPPLRYWSAR